MPKRTAEELAARAEKKAAKAARLEKKAAKAARKAEKEKATGTRRSPRLAPATLPWYTRCRRCGLRSATCLEAGASCAGRAPPLLRGAR